MVKYLCVISFIPASSFAFYSCIIICFFVRILFSAVVWAAVVAKLVILGISSTVNEVIRTILSLFIFLRQNFEGTKTQIKQKPTKATVFCAKRGKSLVLRFLKKLKLSW